jgi:hypothetical protein
MSAFAGGAIASAASKRSERCGWMGKIEVSVVHDELGRIVAVARPTDPSRATVLVGAGQSILVTEIDEERIPGLTSGRHRVDLEGGAIVES